LNAKNIFPANIHHQLVRVYGKGVMNQGNVPEWCGLFTGEGEMCMKRAAVWMPASLLHDSTPPHTAEERAELVEKFG
jgi:hypothetical protein